MGIRQKFAIKLAGMEKQYKNMCVAYHMYEYLCCLLKREEVAKLSSKIFSTNISSINLHLQLGKNAIKLKGIEDWYIKEERIDG